MGMDTVCRIAPKAPSVRANRFIERYAARRGSLEKQLDDPTDAVCSNATTEVPAEPRFVELFNRAFAAARA